MSHSRLQDTCHCDSVNHFRWVLFICFRVASLSGRICLPQIITALRTVLFISHPDGVINSSFLYHVNRIGTIQYSFLFHILSQVLHKIAGAKGMQHIVGGDDIPIQNTRTFQSSIDLLLRQLECCGQLGNAVCDKFQRFPIHGLILFRCSH